MANHLVLGIVTGCCAGWQGGAINLSEHIAVLAKIGSINLDK